MQRLTAIARRRFATTSTLYVTAPPAGATTPISGSWRWLTAEFPDASADDARRAVAARAAPRRAPTSAGAARRDALERAAARCARTRPSRDERGRARWRRPAARLRWSHAIAASSRLMIRAGLRQDVRRGPRGWPTADMSTTTLAWSTARHRARAPPPAGYELDAACRSRRTGASPRS